MPKRRPRNVPLPIKKQGLGDVVKSILGKLGFKHCEKCDERRRRLNDKFTIGKD